jgi:glyoxylase-like metal-dependent hydrolase (beta-lactamase superfamily II)
MNLEDHLGDIIRKARLMSNVSPKAAAKAGGLTEAELGAGEDAGVFPKPPDFDSLAGVLGLSPTKLRNIANGWSPEEKNLTQWQRFHVFTTAGDGMTVNSYLVWDAATREAALFDTGFDAGIILDTVAKERLLLRDIFITHSHHDHIAALVDVRTALRQARIHGNSKKAPAEQRLKAGETFNVGRLEISFRETPGHAADGVTYIISHWPDDAPPVAIVGDTIFAGSMGRGNDSWQVARQKVREHILSLPPATLLCPGHGPLTTVAEEQENNPFF